MDSHVSRRIHTALAMLVLVVAAPLALADKYDGLTVSFDKPMAEVQKAAIDALTVVGVDVKKQDPNYVEGKRSHKVGVFVGSGGEVLSVALTAVSPQKTEATVRTTKTFVGRMGQKVWDQDVVNEMAKSLGVSSPAAATPAAGTPPPATAAPAAR
jgi:hypothetical protein